MKEEVLVSLGLRDARRAARSMEFIQRNLERIASHLPRDRHILDIYKQLVYDSSIIYYSLHDGLELACMDCGSRSML